MFCDTSRHKTFTDSLSAINVYTRIQDYNKSMILIVVLLTVYASLRSFIIKSYKTALSQTELIFFYTSLLYFSVSIYQSCYRETRK